MAFPVGNVAVECAFCDSYTGRLKKPKQGHGVLHCRRAVIKRECVAGSVHTLPNNADVRLARPAVLWARAAVLTAQLQHTLTDRIPAVPAPFLTIRGHGTVVL